MKLVWDKCDIGPGLRLKTFPSDEPRWLVVQDKGADDYDLSWGLVDLVSGTVEARGVSREDLIERFDRDRLIPVHLPIAVAEKLSGAWFSTDIRPADGRTVYAVHPDFSGGQVFWFRDGQLIDEDGGRNDDGWSFRGMLQWAYLPDLPFRFSEYDKDWVGDKYDWEKDGVYARARKGAEG